MCGCSMIGAGRWRTSSARPARRCASGARIGEAPSPVAAYARIVHTTEEDGSGRQQRFLPGARWRPVFVGRPSSRRVGRFIEDGSMAASVAGSEHRGQRHRAAAAAAVAFGHQRQEPPVRPGRGPDRAPDLRGGPTGAGEGAGPQAGNGRPAVATARPRWLARLSYWFWRQQHGPLHDRIEATATNPAIVAAVGADEARRIAYESYGSVIEDHLLSLDRPRRKER